MILYIHFYCINVFHVESPALIPSLQSGCYELIWEKCADLPSPLYYASVALHDNKVYTLAGGAPDDHTYDYIYVYDINKNEWDKFLHPGQHRGILQIINCKLTVIGGMDVTNGYKITNKVKTYNNSNDTWSNEYPDLQKSRLRPGVLTHLDYVIVVGGQLEDKTYSYDIELLNYKQSPQWMMAMIRLPYAMQDPSLTIGDDMLYIVGFRTYMAKTIDAYKVSVDMVTSSVAQLTGNQTDHWTKLPSLPYYHFAIIPKSCPPAIMGGGDKQGVPKDDVRMLDVPNNTWKKVGSLTTAILAPAVVPINHNSILVIGGSTGGGDVEEDEAHCIKTVEKGTVRLCHK